MRKFLLLTLIFSGANSLFSQENLAPDTIKSPSFFEQLLAPDSLSGASVSVEQDERLRTILDTPRDGSALSNRVFRVQIFSSNATKTARNTAFSIERKILNRFPEMAVYVTYTAPFWKVRVGDCATQPEAAELRRFLVEAFPEHQSEIYIVPEQIVK